MTDEKAAQACMTCLREGQLNREQHTLIGPHPRRFRDGQKVRLRELGGPGKHGGAPGGMHVTVHVID